MLHVSGRNPCVGHRMQLRIGWLVSLGASKPFKFQRQVQNYATIVACVRRALLKRVACKWRIVKASCKILCQSSFLFAHQKWYSHASCRFFWESIFIQSDLTCRKRWISIAMSKIVTQLIHTCNDAGVWKVTAYGAKGGRGGNSDSRPGRFCISTCALDICP